MSESKLQANVIKALKNKYGKSLYLINVHGGNRQKKGVPDLVFCLKGVFMAIELKIGSNKPTEKQDYEISLIQQAEGYAGVAWSVEEASMLASAWLDLSGKK